jgi:Secretion system C-terminal sorting domain
MPIIFRSYKLSKMHTVSSESGCFNLEDGANICVVTDINGCSYTAELNVFEIDGVIANDVLVSNQSQADAAFSNEEIYVHGNITFNNSSSILIEDKFFYLNEASEILIEAGSVVEFRNCLFTACDTYWQGFRVYSSPNGTMPIYDDIEGRLIFSALGSPCRVEFAVTAIKTGGSLGAQGNLRSAGRIECTNTEFYNNKMAADIRNSNTKLSHFTLCNFDVDDNFATRFGNTPFMRHIWCDKTKWLSIAGCNFENNNTQVNNWNDRKVAVFAYNSPIIVGAHAATVNDPGIPCTFTGFNEGVKAFTWIPQYNGIIIRDNEFTRNRRAIHCSNTSFHFINRNTISVGEPTGIPALDAAQVVYTGIYQNGGAQFEIMENEITGFITAAPDNLDPVMPFTVGICVARTKTTDDEIYRNFLNSLNYGNVANGDNGEGNAGLRYVCNENTNNHFDFVVSDNFMWLAEAQIANIQQDNAEGQNNPNQSAANTFIENADNNSLEFQNFWNEGVNQILEYRRDPNDINETPNSGEYTGINEIIDEANNACASETEKTVTIEGTIIISEHINFLERRNTTWLAWQSAKYLYTLLIDGGNTQQLQEQVEFAWTNDTWQMRSELLSKSPYLSIEVLYTVADKVEVFPHAIALEIFMANPDVLKDNRFMRYLEMKSEPMPAYMIDLLLAARDQSTMRAIVERNLSFARSTYVEATGNVLRTQLQDPNYNMANLMLDLEPIKTFPSDVMVIEEYLQLGDITGANDRYNTMLSSAEFSVYDKREWSAYGAWLQLRTTMVQSGYDFENLPIAQIDELTAIADAHWNSYAGRSAMEILNAYYNGEYDTEPMISSGAGGAKRTRETSETLHSQLHIYPNPASDYLLVQMDLLTSISAQELLVTDSNGNQIYAFKIQDAKQQIAIDVQNWANGSYIVSIFQDGHMLESETIHVVR